MKTVEEVAVQLKRTPARVRQVVAAMKLGKRAGKRLILLGDEDIEKIANRKTQYGPKAKEKK